MDAEAAAALYYLLGFEDWMDMIPSPHWHRRIVDAYMPRGVPGMAAEWVEAYRLTYEPEKCGTALLAAEYG